LEDGEILLEVVAKYCTFTCQRMERCTAGYKYN
jgi:hypothetical protein